jgi:hypothetical protein
MRLSRKPDSRPLALEINGPASSYCVLTKDSGKGDMMAGMYRLFYVSTKAEDLSEEDADAIADHAAQNNDGNDIVGALCYNGMNFGQVLEGPQNEVFKLLDTIRSDKRHHNMIVISEKPVRFRYFKDFHMKRIRGMDFQELVKAMAAE